MPVVKTEKPPSCEYCGYRKCPEDVNAASIEKHQHEWHRGELILARFKELKKLAKGFTKDFDVNDPLAVEYRALLREWHTLPARQTTTVSERDNTKFPVDKPKPTKSRKQATLEF